MKIKKQHIFSLLVLFSIISALFIANISHSNTPIENNNNILKTNDSIHFSQIYTNESDGHIVSIFEAINYTVNAGAFSNWNSMEMEISFIDGTSETFWMSQIGSTSNFTVAYAPDYNAPTGTHNISFYIYDNIGVVLNDIIVDKILTIESNYYSITFSKDEFYVGDVLYGTIIVQNVTGYTFETYQVSIVNSTETPQIQIFGLADNIKYFNLTISQDNFEVINKEYFVKLTLIDGSITGDIYIPFMVSNYDPEIIQSSFSLSAGESTIDPIYRSENDDYWISVNVTDVESIWIYLNVSLVIYKPDGLIIQTIDLIGNENNNFSAEFHIDIGFPIGRYRFQIKAEDPDDGLSEYFKDGVIVANNLPEINSYEINGMSMTERISVFYGEDILFDSFNVTDVEGTISYITISLLNENDEWYEITRAYSTSLSIKISSVDLLSGVWTVYMTVIDVDGDSTDLTFDYGLAPQQIRIIPDTLSKIIPYLTLLIGAILGVIIGIAIGFRMLKFRSESKVQQTKKKQISKTKKVIEKTPKKVEKKEEKAETEEKKETQPIKKKIKRRL